MKLRMLVLSIHIVYVSNRFILDKPNSAISAVKSEYGQNKPRFRTRSLKQDGGDSKDEDEEQQGFQLLGIRALGSGVQKYDDMHLIPTEQPVRLLFFGTGLHSLSVKFTSDVTEKNASCEKLSQTVEYTMTKIQNRDNVFNTVVTMKNSDEVYHICIADRFQGVQKNLMLVTMTRRSIVWTILLIVLFLGLSSLFSGLTLGLMALDKNQLQVLASRKHDPRRQYAQSILPLRKRGNLILCSLIFANVFVNTAMTILLETLTSSYLAIIVSTLSIVLIGEILPQAVCKKYGLFVGAKTKYVTILIVLITLPLSLPIALLLDLILGDEIGSVYDRERLLEYIKVTKNWNRLEEDELNIIFGALVLNKKTVGEIMKPLSDVFMIPMSTVLNHELIALIVKNDFSRIPVHEDGDRSNVLGILYVKDIILHSPEVGTPIQNIVSSPRHPLIFTREDERLKWALDQFKVGRCHMAFVKPKPQGRSSTTGGVIGVVTLEDILEEILQSELTEEDESSDLKQKGAQYRRDLTDFLRIGESRPASHYVSPHLLRAVFDYLSESKALNKISPRVLRRLIDQRIYFNVKHSNSSAKEMDEEVLLYIADSPCDYFILVLEGNAQIMAGKEKLVFTRQPFCDFGAQALEMSEANYSKWKSEVVGASSRLDSKTPSSTCSVSEFDPSLFTRTHFIPDFTVQVLGGSLYMKLSRPLYLAACKATILEDSWTNAKRNVMTETEALLQKAIVAALPEKKTVRRTRDKHKATAETALYIKTSKTDLSIRSNVKSIKK